MQARSSLCRVAAATCPRAAVQAGPVAPDVLGLGCLQQISRLEGPRGIIRGLRAGQSPSAGQGNLQTLRLSTSLSQRGSLIRGTGEIHLGGN